MTSFYSVVQYVPDSSADERLNIGLVVVGGETVKVQFLDDWQRARAFGGEDISYLQSFADEISSAASHPQLEPSAENPANWSVDRLREMSETWNGNIQFAVPRPAVIDADRLMALMSRRLLRARPVKHRAYPDQREFIAAATARVKRKLTEEYGDLASRLVRNRFPVRGRLDEQRWDIVLTKPEELGEVYFATRGISFDGVDRADRRHEINNSITNAAWAIDDLRNRDHELPIAIVVTPHAEESKAYVRARDIFQGLGVEVLTEQTLDDWAGLAARSAGLTPDSFRYMHA
jgi:Protein of unknown function (DUF3037)